MHTFHKSRLYSMIGEKWIILSKYMRSAGCRNLNWKYFPNAQKKKKNSKKLITAATLFPNFAVRGKKIWNKKINEVFWFISYSRKRKNNNQKKIFGKKSRFSTKTGTFFIVWKIFLKFPLVFRCSWNLLSYFWIFYVTHMN